MAEYNDHLFQARRNLKFLGSINANCGDFVDWQVTTCFYVGVHLVNSFLAKEANFHFASHERVKEAISPDSNYKTKLPEEQYVAYGKLRNLSRRSRYLCAENNEDPATAHFTVEKHFTKALKNLDNLLQYFNKRYQDEYPTIQITFPFADKVPHCVFFTFRNSSPGNTNAA